MPYVNKKSLREEFEDLKSEFEKLSTENKITKESRVLFKAMLMLFDVMLVVFMEKTTRIQVYPHHRLKKMKPQRLQATNLREKSKTANFLIIPTQKNRPKLQRFLHAQHCGEDLRNTISQKPERRTRIDIIFEKVVCHVDAKIKECPRCKAKNKGHFPSDMHGPLQYGPGIKAYHRCLGLIAQHEYQSSNLF